MRAVFELWPEFATKRDNDLGHAFDCVRAFPGHSAMSGLAVDDNLAARIPFFAYRHAIHRLLADNHEIRHDLPAFDHGNDAGRSGGFLVRDLIDDQFAADRDTRSSERNSG